MVPSCGADAAGLPFEPHGLVDEARGGERKRHIDHGRSVARAICLSHRSSGFLETDDVDVELNFKHVAGTVLRDVPKDWDIIFFGHTNIPGVTSEYKHGLAKEARNSHVYTSVEPRGQLSFRITRPFV